MNIQIISKEINKANDFDTLKEDVEMALQEARSVRNLLFKYAEAVDPWKYVVIGYFMLDSKKGSKIGCVKASSTDNFTFDLAYSLVADHLKMPVHERIIITGISYLTKEQWDAWKNPK